MSSRFRIKGILSFFVLFGLIFGFSCSAVKAETGLKQSFVQKNVELPPLRDYNQSKKLVAREYVLGANDALSVEFLGIPELSKELKVQPDGKISMAYMKDFHVAGKTISEVQNLILQTYDKYLENPEVNIKVIQTRPFIVYISGAILNPGSYELNTVTNQSPYITKPESYIERKTPLLSNIIVAAGGFSHDADAEKVLVSNDLDGSSFRVDLLELIKNADSSQDIYLTAGDRIHIPKLPSRNFIDPEKYKALISSTLFQRTIPVKVVGYVNNPGLVNLNSTQSANLSSAIAKAGGYLKNAAYLPKKVLISRADNNEKFVTFAIDPRERDLALMPNDIVYVPEKIRPKIGKFFDFTARLFAPAFMFTNTFYSWDRIVE